ncbi:Ankyrin repeat-containing domain protein [Moelleriella libera RCEF 2490]|uniref:Ankyrin repeat-containing domain protein n=1 Tax=Moelleriella libera RCEF 2490 TaxID=1081109 RepID=A0A167WFY0_9HYPO|nr:Ankyrin repeat-containing domain protein [Moelleriella libera RCEF 2490]
MRLFMWDDDGALKFSKNYLNDIPRYAILSHTWGPDDEEVTYDDIKNGTGQNKAGYTKIDFCARLAKESGLKFFWVDTCCIKKMDFTELHEAINSMFKWYRDATRCFVYLTDVSLCGQSHTDAAAPPWKAAFRTSRWFTRGWTLQELLAPKSVEFFACEGEKLCERNTMAQEIHEITGIPKDALYGTSLTSFSTEERMRWTEKRTTTKQEDQAYCLLGIFGVYMSLIYGEGENAMLRLKKEVENSSKATIRAIKTCIDRDDADDLAIEIQNHYIDLNAAEVDGTCPAICYAAHYGRVNAFKLLMRQPGINIDIADPRWRQRPLFRAVKSKDDKARNDRHLEIVRILLDSGKVDINAQDEYGKTALTVAAIFGVTEGVKMLSNAGADRTIRDDNRMMPLDYVREKLMCEKDQEMKRRFGQIFECLEQPTL